MTTPAQPEFRVIRDPMGEMKIPMGTLYGPQTQRAIENFQISGLKPSPYYVRATVLIKKAAALVNHDLGLIPGEYSRMIVQVADEILGGKWMDQFVVDPFQAGGGTSHNMNVNEVIANRANQLLGKRLIHPNDHVNMAQSTNDVIPTSIRIACLLRLEELVGSLSKLVAALFAKGSEFADVIKSGRTHLQDAVPMTLGQEFNAYAEAVRHDVERIKRAGDTLRQLGIGGTAVGSGLNAHPEFHARMVVQLTELTGIQFFESDNLFERMQSMADMVDFSASIKTCALTLIRIANDLRLLSSGPRTGLNEIRLPAIMPGSSIMPGKINPVIAEMLNLAMFHLVGCDLVVGMAAQAGQLEINAMSPAIAHNLTEMIQIMINSVNVFRERCVIGITANEEKAAEWLENNPIIITALNPLIGYAEASDLMRESQESGLSIRQVALNRVAGGLLIHKDTGRRIELPELEAAFLNLERQTRGGIL